MLDPRPDRHPTVSPTEVLTSGQFPATEEPTPPEEPTALAKKRIGVIGWIAIVFLVLLVVVCALAPILPIPSPQQLYPEFSGPAAIGPFKNVSHILGTTQNGNDMLSQTIWGGRASLTVSIGAILLGFVIGGFFGLVAGYFRGWTDTIITAVMNIMLAFPALVLALFLVAVLQGDPTHPQGFHLPNELVIIIALGIVGIPLLGRLTRASALSWSQREFVLAARAQGARAPRIIFREVLPNCLPAMFSLALLSVGIAIVAEGVLSLLGVGVAPPTPSWGNMIALGQSGLANNQAWLVLVPVVAMFLAVFALNYVGDVVREIFDVRESSL